MTDETVDGGIQDRAHCTRIACQNAFGTDDANAFDPGQGFGANRDAMLRIYTYSQTPAQKAPDLFLCMGLGHLAGGTIVSGLDQGLAPDLVQQTLLATAKAIFLDLG